MSTKTKQMKGAVKFVVFMQVQDEDGCGGFLCDTDPKPRMFDEESAARAHAKALGRV